MLRHLTTMTRQPDPDNERAGAGDAVWRTTTRTVAPGPFRVSMVTQTLTYDARGRLVSSTGPEGTTVYNYDAVGLLSSLTKPNGATVSYEVRRCTSAGGGKQMHRATGASLSSMTREPGRRATARCAGPDPLDRAPDLQRNRLALQCL